METLKRPEEQVYLIMDKAHESNNRYKRRIVVERFIICLKDSRGCSHDMTSSIFYSVTSSISL